jgi:hypothetical protein
MKFRKKITKKFSHYEINFSGSAGVICKTFLSLKSGDDFFPRCMYVICQKLSPYATVCLFTMVRFSTQPAKTLHSATKIIFINTLFYINYLLLIYNIQLKLSLEIH